VDREARKIIVENGGKHTDGSTAMLYLPREKGRRGLRVVETEYKVTKVKAAVKLYENKDPAMGMVREFEERAESLSPADRWNNCAFYDKRMKLGTQVRHIRQSIFSYRAISDWSRDQYGGSF